MYAEVTGLVGHLAMNAGLVWMEHVTAGMLIFVFTSLRLFEDYSYIIPHRFIRLVLFTYSFLLTPLPLPQFLYKFYCLGPVLTITCSL